MRIILLGAPGSGKGTQGEVLAQHFGIRHLSTGDVLRAEIAGESDVGRAAAAYVASGELVPDDLIMQLMGGAVVEAAEAGGYILDGFPRTIEQANRAYELAKPAGITADAVVYLAVPDDVAAERIAARAGAGRVDDLDPVVTRTRLDVFHAQTEPLLEFYRSRGILVTIDATPPPIAVSAAMLEALSGISE